jgi:hypothetical protein
MLKTYKGSCHCGAVQFECDLDLSEGTSRCNCSFCSKTRFWKAFAKGSAFRLLQGSEVLSDYQYTPSSAPSPMLHLFFCSRCGVRPFTRGWLAEFGGEFHAVYLACLNDAEADLAQAPIQYQDGRNDNWDSSPAETRHL